MCLDALSFGGKTLKKGDVRGAAIRSGAVFRHIDAFANGQGTAMRALWWAAFGSSNIWQPIATHDGVVDSADSTMWRDHLGAGLGNNLAAASTVPEHTSLAYALATLSVMCVARRTARAYQV